MASANPIVITSHVSAAPTSSTIVPPSPVFSVAGSSRVATLRHPIGGVGNGLTRLAMMERLILDISDPSRREAALALLSRQVGCKELAPMLWLSFGTVLVLLDEIISIFPFLSPPTLTLAQSNRVCNVLALVQCMASHPETKSQLIKAYFPVYLFFFIKTTCLTKPFEHLKLNSLGVIGALVKVPDTQVVLFLLSNELMPACLSAMENGSELSKTVSTFIMQRIMLDDVGLEYMCSTRDRLCAINKALANVVAGLVKHPSARLLKHVIRCYLRLSQHERSLWLLRYSLPARLVDGTFHRYLWGDETAKSWLQQLLDNVYRQPIAYIIGTHCSQYIDKDALHCTVIGIF